jgi:hypothetical protein
VGRGAGVEGARGGRQGRRGPRAAAAAAPAASAATPRPPPPRAAAPAPGPKTRHKVDIPSHLDDGGGHHGDVAGEQLCAAHHAQDEADRQAERPDHHLVEAGVGRREAGAVGADGGHEQAAEADIDAREDAGVQHLGPRAVGLGGAERDDVLVPLGFGFWKERVQGGRRVGVCAKEARAARACACGRVWNCVGVRVCLCTCVCARVCSSVCVLPAQ